MDDLSDVIELLKTGDYSVARPAVRAVNTTTGEIATASTASTFTIAACVQPAPGRDLKRLPEGRRKHDVKSIWTETALLVQDVITIAAEAYEVEYLYDWTAAGNF